MSGFLMVALMDECAPDMSLAGDSRFMYTNQRRLSHATARRNFLDFTLQLHR